MTATSTSTACIDQQPALYRLVHQSRWSSSSDLTVLHDRLVYLSSLHSASVQAASTQVPTSGIENNVGAENNDEEMVPATRYTRCNECPARKRALSELHYTDVHTQRTALHILCYWRPRLQLVSQFLGMAPHMVWSRSSSGETALHLACSNATRMAGADVIELLLRAAEMTASDVNETYAECSKAQRRRRYALLTDERGWTALHCAVQADAPTSVLDALLKAAPEAAIMSGGHAASSKTPVDILNQTYELFIDQYLNCENDKDDVTNRDDNEPQDADTIDNSSTLPDTLRHFWDKLTILLRAGCQALQDSPCEDLQILHATLILLSDRKLQMPSSLLRFIIMRCVGEEAHVVDGAGYYALHYGAQALARGAVDATTVQKLLDANPDAARLRSSEERYPLQLLLQSNGIDTRSVIRLVQETAQAYPPAIAGTSAYSHELAPHIIKMLCRENDQSKAGQQTYGGIGNIFDMLRTEPSLMKHI